MSSINEDVEMKDVEDEEDEEDAVAEELGEYRSSPERDLMLTSCTDKSEDEEEEEYPDEDDEVPAMPKGRNKQLTVGYKGDRSYVVREDKIGVFSHTGHNSVKYYASISNVATPEGKAFSPRHVRWSTNVSLGQNAQFRRSTGHVARSGYEDDPHEPQPTPLPLQP